MLANGDKRDCFVVIDQAGGHHALNKKLTGLTLAALRDRLADLDRAQLPSVDQAKAMQQEKYPTPEQAREAWNSRAGAEQAQQPEPAAAATAHAGERAAERNRPRSKAAADIHATWSQSPNAGGFRIGDARPRLSHGACVAGGSAGQRTRRGLRQGIREPCAALPRGRDCRHQ